MTLYARLDADGFVVDYPYDLGDLRKICSFRADPPAESLAEHGVVIVHKSGRPAEDYRWNVREGFPQLVGDRWQQHWDIEPATEAEIAERTAAKAAAVKSQRNELLQACDWTQLPDAPTDRQAWAAYREQLRQIKAQPGFPWHVAWPTPPA